MLLNKDISTPPTETSVFNFSDKYDAKCWLIIVCRKGLLKIIYNISNSLKKASSNKSSMFLFLIILQTI